MSAENDSKTLDLLYPFYLDADMSMAFSAALTGGVAMVEEHVDTADEGSAAMRNLRGSLRFWRAGGFEAGRSASDTTAARNESRLERHHTMASIFINLYDELRRTSRLTEDPAFDDMAVGDLVAVRMGPAVAPLRRVVDQMVRLLDLMLPILSAEAHDEAPAPQGTRQQRRAHAREAAKHALTGDENDGVRELQQLRQAFLALQEDLEHSGMIDVVVANETGPSAVLTLDKRFLSSPTLELLHTSAFTVVGKVTRIWKEPDDVVNLYRKSVLSLLPSLAEATVWGVFVFLGSLAQGIDVRAIEQAAREAVQAGPEGSHDSPAENPGVDPSPQEAPGNGASDSPEKGPSEEYAQSDDDDAAGDDDEVKVGDDIAALNPALSGPAFQLLPLAICS